METGSEHRSVEFSNLSIKALIGKENEKLYEVVDQVTGATYYMKEFIALSDSSDRSEISREIEILKKLDHPNLIRCIEVFEAGDNIYLLLEHMDRGSAAAAGDISSESELASVAYQVLLGLAYLHDKKIPHGDVKPSNIFVNSTAGQVKVLYTGRILSKIPVVPAEIGAALHDEFSWDVWCVGLCLLKLFKGFERGFGDTELGDSEAVHRSPQQAAVVDKPSKELWRFLFCCMQMQTDVWTAEELLDELFLRQISGRSRKEKWELSVSPATHSYASKKQESLSCASEKPESLLESRISDFFPDTYSPLLYDAFDAFWDTAGEEEISPKTKKPKISIEGEQDTYDFESIGVPRETTSHIDFGKCIQHCALFLPDCEFEKGKLVEMWIAEGCFEFEVTKRMEDVGNSYFDTLVHQEVIIPSKFDPLYRQMKYKVNTSIASTWSSKGSSYIRIDEGNFDGICRDAQHLTWHCKTLAWTSFEALKSFKQLCTLVVLADCNTLIKKLPSDIFLCLSFLRTLDLSGTLISELPDSIGVSVSLRYLDISKTPIKRLPESTDRLYLLQTLKLRGCFGISALPRGFGKLINLRHLDLNIVGQLKSMPREMGNLIKLQTIQAFVVGKNDRCGISELKNMNEITGSFCISRLENVSSAEEAKEAALGDKQHIDKLELRWQQDHETDNSQDTAEILECLQPHFHLKELQITFYSGSKLPRWISNPSFIDLASITLYKCINCDILPTIGVLPSLKILHIVEMKNLRDINTLFCRSYGTKSNAFPMLEKLTLDEMINLEEWTGVEDGDFPCLRHISIGCCSKVLVLPSLSSLCSLKHLEINHCMQLLSLPELPGSLESLIIRGCPKINERCLKAGEDFLKIASIENLWIDFEKISFE